MTINEKVSNFFFLLFFLNYTQTSNNNFDRRSLVFLDDPRPQRAQIKNFEIAGISETPTIIFRAGREQISKERKLHGTLEVHLET